MEAWSKTVFVVGCAIKNQKSLLAIFCLFFRRRFDAKMAGPACGVKMIFPQAIS
jgi:hypothetical protein